MPTSGRGCVRSLGTRSIVAAKRAEGLLAGSSASEQLVRQVTEQVRDLVMVLQLRDITSSPFDPSDNSNIEQADRDYSAAFRDYGIDIESLPPEEAADQLRVRTIRRELAVGLDHWAMSCTYSRKRSGDFWRRLLALARAADPDANRNQFRDAWEHRDHKTLVLLAASDSPANLKMPNLELLARALSKSDGRGSGWERAIPLLRKAQQQHPDSFWANYLLSTYLFNQRQPQPDDLLQRLPTACASHPKEGPAGGENLKNGAQTAHKAIGRTKPRSGKPLRGLAFFTRPTGLEPVTSCSGGMRRGYPIRRTSPT